jgi:sterol desaturase/sphingolipid hydroxylase (fatty acid hydroxylase superfamily)
MKTGFLSGLGRDLKASDRGARVYHWHPAMEARGVDKNFAIHFPVTDRIFGTRHFPAGTWPQGYSVPEDVPHGCLMQMRYPFVRKPR